MILLDIIIAVVNTVGTFIALLGSNIGKTLGILIVVSWIFSRGNRLLLLVQVQRRKHLARGFDGSFGTILHGFLHIFVGALGKCKTSYRV